MMLFPLFNLRHHWDFESTISRTGTLYLHKSMTRLLRACFLPGDTWMVYNYCSSSTALEQHINSAFMGLRLSTAAVDDLDDLLWML